MASRKEYEMLFQLNAQLGGGFNSTFSKAQKELSHLQKDIQALSKLQNDISAYQKQQGAIEATRAKLSTLQQQYDNIQKEIRETEGYSSSLENKLLSKQQQIDKTSASLQQQTDKLNQMGSALRSAGVNTDNLSSETSRLTDRMDELKGRQEEIADGAEEYGASASEAFGVVQNAIVAAGVTTALKEIADAYMECINASMEFESAMTGVSKTTDMSDGELAAMAEEIKTLSTEIPITTTELANVAEVAGQLGIAKDDLLDFSTIMSMLSTATTMSADEAATMLAQFANITQMDPKYYSNLASTIVDLGNNYATTEQKITEMAQGIAASASLAGMSEADMVALSAAVTSLGIETQAGATSMSKLISELGSAVETGDNLGQIASIANMTSAEFQEAWGQNAVTALEAFVVGLNDVERNGMSATQALSELDINEVRMQRMILSMANSGDLLSRTLSTANNAWKENTALTVEAEKRYATTQSKLTMMQNSYNNLKVSIGDALIPEMRGLYDIGTEVMSGASEFISTNPTLVKSVTAFVGVLGAATAGMTAYAAISKTVKALELGSLFTTGGPIMLAVAGAAALATAVIGITDAYNEARIAARRYGDEVTAAADEYREAMNTSDELESHISEWRSLNETISSGAASADEVTAAKERLKETEQWLIDNYGIYLNNDGTISEEEINSLEQRNEELRETARLQAEIALYDAKTKYDDAKGDIEDTQTKRDKLSSETTQMAKEQSILTRHSTRWEHTMESEEYQNADLGEQQRIFNEAISNMHADLREIGNTDDYSGSGFAGVDASLSYLTDDIEENQAKLKEYNTELKEYYDSAAAYKKATRDIIDMNLSDIPTDNLQEFGEIARSIGEQAANAELDASELENYANRLTEIAHAAGLIPENQQIVFNADGALNVIEEVEDGIHDLDGQTVEITADANADAAYATINGVQYKVLQYDESTGIATLSADGTNASMQINLATGEVHEFDEEEAEAYLDANIDNLKTNVSTAKSLLSSIKDKTVTITSVFKSVGDKVKSMFGFGGYATGTDYATPGAHWVGENGPELLWFNGGEKVLDAKKSAALVKEQAEADAIISSIATVGNNVSDQSEYISSSQEFSEVAQASSLSPITPSGQELAELEQTAYTPYATAPEISDERETTFVMQEYSENAQMQIAYFNPLFTAAMESMQRAEPIATAQGGGTSYVITIAPQFEVHAESSEDIESVMRKCTNIVTDNVMDALEEAGIDAKRGAYI